MSVGDDERSRQPSTSNMTENFGEIPELVHKDWTIHELTDTIGITYGLCQISIQNLNTCCITTKFVP
jgi:hypothetical protein